MVEVVNESSLFPSAHLVDVFQIENGSASGAEDCALVARGHVAARPVFGTADGASGLVEHDDVAGQILVHGAKSVVDPRTKRGSSAEEVAGVHHQHCGAVDGRVGRHGVNEGDVVHVLGKVGKKSGDCFAALSVLLEVPFRADDAALLFVAAAPEGFDVHGFAVQRVQFGFVVEGVHVTGSSVHEEEDDVFGFAGEMRLFWLQRAFPRGFAVGGNELAAEEAVFFEQSGQCQRGESASDGVEKVSPRASAKSILRFYSFHFRFSLIFNVPQILPNLQTLNQSTITFQRIHHSNLKRIMTLFQTLSNFLFQGFSCGLADAVHDSGFGCLPIGEQAEIELLMNHLHWLSSGSSSASILMRKNP